MGGRRRLAAGIAAIAVVGGLAWWWLRDGGSARDAVTDPEGATRGAARLGRTAGIGMPRWLGQVGLEPRRIAGRVTLVSARDGARADDTVVEVEAGKTASVTLTSKGTATVNGRAIDLVTREAIAGLECNGSLAWNDREQGTRTDSQREGRAGPRPRRPGGRGRGRGRRTKAMSRVFFS